MVGHRGLRAGPARALAPTGAAVGVDLGIASVLTTTNRVQVANPRYLARSRHRLAAEQRSLARKVKGSGRRAAQGQRVEARHRKIARQRADHAHQLSRSLVQRFDVIVHEDLRIANLVRSASGSVEHPGTQRGPEVGAQPMYPRRRLGSARGVPRL